jgi:hypothetical protein
MIDPTTLDFNMFQGAITTSNPVVQKPNTIPTVLIFVGICAIAVGVSLYFKKKNPKENNEFRKQII